MGWTAVLETQSKQKTSLFASVLAGTWNSQFSKWDEVSQTLKLIRSLEDVHINILKHALEVHVWADGGDNTFTVDARGLHARTHPDNMLKDVDTMLLTSCISDLISSGLLNDSFETSPLAVVSGADVNETPKATPLTYAISPLGVWFLQRINDPELMKKR